MKLFVFMCLSVSLLTFGSTNAQKKKYEAIHSGIALFDQFNKEVNAHGSCIVKEGDLFYLFGEFHTDTSNVFNGFSCYSSPDLMNWKFEKMVLPVQSDGLLGPNRIGERVKVMKCPATGEFVMYMHTDDIRYNDPHVGFATCKTINGDYQFQGELLLNGKYIRKWDLGTFQDTDGKGYLLTHSGFIYELDSGYKSVKRIVTSEKLDGESPAMFKSNGVYFWLFSHRTSWERNDNFYLTATSLEGPWTNKGIFAPEGTLTWNSQTSFVLPIANKKDTLFMFMGDRWSYPLQGSAATYVWQPIRVKGDKMSIPDYQENWRVNLANVKWSPVETIAKSIKASATIKTGDWKQENGKIRAKQKGSVILFPFRGRQVGLKALSNPTSGYAKVVIRNKKGDEIISTIVDFYSKYEYSSLKFLSPVLDYNSYVLSIEVLGEHPKWSDKRFFNYGSTDDYVDIEDVFLVETKK
ncbi:MAG: glycosyl hydrolase family 43 [Paludibacter sp.]